MEITENEEESILEFQRKGEWKMGPPDTTRPSRPSIKEGGVMRCGKCKTCKHKCEECTSCLTEPKKPGGLQKGCEKREICINPKKRSPTRTPSRSESQKREGDNLEDKKAKVKKKMEDLEKKNQAALTESSMVATG